MKVLEHGNTYQMIRCKKCAALLGVTKADIQEEEVITENHDKKYHFEWIVCPDCNRHAWFEETIVWQN